MATVVFTYNHARDPMNPDQLADQIATSLTLSTAPVVDINPTQIVVTHGSVTEANRTAIQNLINAYVFDSTWAGGVTGVLLGKAVTAMASNATFLALASPTTAQTLTQVKALTRQVNALIRLAANQLDSTTGT